MRRGLATAGVALSLVSAVSVLVPMHAGAHAFLLRADPADGSVLGTAPGAVILDFNQALDPTLSEATVTDPSRRAVTVAPVSKWEIRVDLVTGLPGEYLVTWTAVSGEDGHTTVGDLKFAVEAPVLSRAASTSGVVSGLDAEIAIARWAEDAALLMAVGMLFIGWLGRRRPDLGWVRVRLLPPLLGGLVAGVAVVAGEAVAASHASFAGAAVYLFTGPAGLARLARVALEATAVVVGAARLRARRAAVVAALVALAASGHAAGGGTAWWTVAIDASHLVAAGVWAGGIIALAILHPPGGWRSGGRSLLTRFSPWALAAFSATVGLGVLEAAGALGSVSALVTTAYGRILLAKAAGVILMVPLSLAAWRLRRYSLRGEAAIGVGVIAAAALLASFPVPARTAAADGATLSAAPAAVAGLPGAGELTLGGHAGEILVGLTIGANGPGWNRLTFYVMPVEGGAAAAALQVTASADGTTLALTRCGDTCRSATAHLSGMDAVTAEVAGPHGGTARFQLPALPAPDAATLVRAARSRMSRLRSVTLHETLSGGTGRTITTDYAEAAPDSLQWTQPGGAALVAIGSTRYARTNGSSPWTRESGNPVTPEPQLMWQYFPDTLAAHVLGHQVIDGVDTTEVGFFSGAPGTPIWFRFAIDSTGLVRHAEMLAPGHFMTQVFAGFNSTSVVEAAAH